MAGDIRTKESHGKRVEAAAKEMNKPAGLFRLQYKNAFTGHSEFAPLYRLLVQAFFLTTSLENDWAQKLRSIEFLSQNP